MENGYQINGVPGHSQMTNGHMGSVQQRMPTHADGHTLPPLNDGALPSYSSAYTVGMAQHPLTTTASYPNVSQPSPASNIAQIQAQRIPQQHLAAYSQAGAFPMTQSMMPPSSNMMAAAHTVSSGGRALPDLHPRPAEGAYLTQIHSASNMLTPAQTHQSETEPTHVVGQQGRRGILPSAPGRAPGAVKSTVPQKDANGKYPCPHCVKTYQHAKHLKRHLLRHTGDRPYMCKLCKDTFSRSDILKRHFQKCSIRRGVVGDMDHLEGSRTQMQKNRQSIDTTQNIQFMNSVNPSPVYDGGPTSASAQMGSVLGQQQYRVDGMQPNSARNSRSNSIVQPSNGFLDNRRSMSGLEQLQTSNAAYGPYSASSGLPGILANTIQSATQSPVHGVTNGLSNGHAYNGYGGADVPQNLLHEGQHNNRRDPVGRSPVSSLFLKADHDNTQNGQTLPSAWLWSNTAFQAQAPSATHNQGLPPNALYAKLPSTLLSGVLDDEPLGDEYTRSTAIRTRLAYGAWNKADPTEARLRHLISLCASHLRRGFSESDDQNEIILGRILTHDNVQLFIEEFKNFQAHWPVLHTPTFNPGQAHDSLLLAMIVIGAVYSEKLPFQETLWLMSVVKGTIHGSSSMLANNIKQETNATSSPSHEIEEILALLLLQCLSLWHGSEPQRAQAREDFPHLAAAVRRYGLLRNTGLSHDVKPSVLHRIDSDPPLIDGSWDWKSWIEQEKRYRAFYILYLMDCALTIYFNCPPQIGPGEVLLRLAADDAAWEATTSEDCARMLGLFGPDAQAGQNISGSLALRQPEFQSALSKLFDQSVPPQVRETNAYGKFILVHALHAMLWNAQRNLASPGDVFAVQRASSDVNNTGLHVAETSKVSHLVTVPGSLSTAGHVSVDNIIIAHDAEPSTIRLALGKWKRSWDVDKDLQYRERLPRLGFCRDGVYFYHLATYLYDRCSNNSGTVLNDTHIPPDTKFAFVIDLLKKIKRWIVNEQGKAGLLKEIGSVGSIDAKYGIDDLMLDIKLLFVRILPRLGRDT